MANKAWWRALSSLAHPFSLGAVALLLFNNYVLREVFPSWWSGKLGDLAWLIFFPLIVALPLAWIVPPRVLQQERIVGSLAFILTGLGFALAKTIPFFHLLAVQVLESIHGAEDGLRRDPSDLLALPGLWISWRIWQQAESRPPIVPVRGWIVLSIGSLATVANQFAGPDYGVACLYSHHNNVVAVAHLDEVGSPHTFITDSNGFSWRAVYSDEAGNAVEECAASQRKTSWQLTDSTDENIHYAFYPGVGIDRSEDGGLTWNREVELVKEIGEIRRIRYQLLHGENVRLVPGPLDAIIDPATGNLIAAMGLDGVLVRNSNGEWHWAKVGPYAQLEQLSLTGRLQQLLVFERWLALMVIPLGLVTLEQVSIARQILKFKFKYKHSRIIMVTRWLMVVWMAWFFSLFLLPIEPPLIGRFFQIVAVLITGFLILPLLGQLFALYRRAPQLFISAGCIAVFGSLAFSLPYILWVQETVDRYADARNLSLVLLFSVTVMGYLLLELLFRGTRHSTHDENISGDDSA